MPGLGASLDRFLAGTRHWRGRGARCLCAAAIAMAVVIGGVGIAAEDGRFPPGQNPDPGSPMDTQTRRAETAPRLYVPLHPADPAEVEKQFAIGRNTAFGVQSEELIRSGRDARDQLSSGPGNDPKPQLAAPAISDSATK